ncbi:MAG TPA: hypothetical protein IAA43_03245, partial [Candidatus Olsenella avicola]|nr:hypothetical protein [Candidatus Olsenella avicola]
HPHVAPILVHAGPFLSSGPVVAAPSLGDREGLAGRNPMNIWSGVPALVAIVTCLYFYSEMRTAREATQANGFMRRETFDLTDKADVFTSTSVTRRRIERTDK